MITSDLINSTIALLLLVSGIAAIALSIPGIRKKDYMLFNVGLFFALYGFRWLTEIPGDGNIVAAIMPHTSPYLQSVITYLIPIPFSGFLLNLMGRGLFGTIYWFFISTFVYAAFAVVHDLLVPGGGLNPAIYPGLLAFWCIVGGINVILLQAGNNPELKVLKVITYFFLLCVAYDNLVFMNIVPWKFRLEHLDMIVFYLGMCYIAVRRFRAPGKLRTNVPAQGVKQEPG